MRPTGETEWIPFYEPIRTADLFQGSGLIQIFRYSTLLP
jgi:hypothetical protein